MTERAAGSVKNDGQMAGTWMIRDPHAPTEDQFNHARNVYYRAYFADPSRRAKKRKTDVRSKRAFLVEQSASRAWLRFRAKRDLAFLRERGFHQCDLARLLAVSSACVSRWMTGKTNVKNHETMWSIRSLAHAEEAAWWR